MLNCKNGRFLSMKIAIPILFIVKMGCQISLSLFIRESTLIVSFTFHIYDSLVAPVCSPVSYWHDSYYQGNYDGNYEVAQNNNLYGVELGEILGIGRLFILLLLLVTFLQTFFLNIPLNFFRLFSFLRELRIFALLG